MHTHTDTLTHTHIHHAHEVESLALIHMLMIKEKPIYGYYSLKLSNYLIDSNTKLETIQDSAIYLYIICRGKMKSG